MGEVSDAGEGSVDYLAPFETFQAYSLRRGMVYRGRIRTEFAGDRARLARILDTAPGTYQIEQMDGRVYATLRIYHDGPPKQRLWLHITLLALTVITTLGAGAELAKDNPRPLALVPFEFALESLTATFIGEGSRVVADLWPDFVDEMETGVPYAAALLFILLAHEMGHYLTARKYGVDATLPFLIPAPFFFGTLGAIIKMRSPIVHRRSLFDIGVAGPIAGLVASVIVCVIGLSLSSYQSVNLAPAGSIALGASPLFGALVRGMLGPGGEMLVVQLHPVAVAGWFGLFITFLNLMPLGQLDGGHVWYALMGKKQRYVGLVAFALLVVMGLRFPGWLVLAILVLVLLRIGHPPVMDESVRLGWGRNVGLAVIVVFVLLFIAEPIVVPH